MKNKLLLSLTLVSVISLSSLYANETIEDDLGGFATEEVVDEGSDDLAGFGEDEELVQESTSEVTQEKSMFNLSGNVAFKTAYGYRDHGVKAYSSDTNPIEYSGINQAQTSLFLQLDAKLSDNWKFRMSGDAYYDAIYNIKDENYNQDTLDAYRTELKLNDAYFQGRLTSSLDAKIGHQIVVWGKSDSIRVTDVINPTNNRLPGLTDIEDLRLSVAMAKFDYYIGQWNLSGMVIADNRIFIESAPRSEFFPVDAVFPIGAPDPFIELEQPKLDLNNMQFAFAANGVFSGWDLSFYGAHVYDQKWHIEKTSAGTPLRVVSQIDMLGSAVNVALGSWLLKSEIAYLDGVRYNSTTDAKARLDALVGVDYMGISDTVLSLEIANRHIFDYENQMGELIAAPDYVDENEVQTAMRVTRSFANDTINASALLSMFGASWEYGGFARVWVEYDVMDAVVANVGLVDYIDGDKPFTKAISDNDRVFADITYSF